MGKRKASYVWVDKKTGQIYGRVQVRQPNGKYKSFYTDPADNATHAEQLAEDLLDELRQRGKAFIDGRSMTIAQLAEWYKEEYVIAAVYVGGKKVEGMRTWESERRKIDRVCKSLGHHLINEIDEVVLRRYKRERLKTVGIAAVNRDLESVRAMINKAIKKKWRKESLDFTEVLDKSLETRRTATITDLQETAILEAARDLEYSVRLYPLILALRDSGARPSELYPVNDFRSDYGEPDAFYEPIRWRDLFDDDGQIRDVTVFVSYKGKQREERLGIVSERMKAAFLRLWNHLLSSKAVPEHAASLDNLVFPHKSYQTAWEIVREAAGVPELRLRDLRRDWVTRLARKGFSDKLAQRGAGHKTMQMSFHYTEFNMAAAQEAKSLIDADNISDAVN